MPSLPSAEDLVRQLAVETDAVKRSACCSGASAITRSARASEEGKEDRPKKDWISRNRARTGGADD